MYQRVHLNSHHYFFTKLIMTTDHDTRLYELGEQKLFTEDLRGFKPIEVKILELKEHECIFCHKQTFEHFLGYWCSEECCFNHQNLNIL